MSPDPAPKGAPPSVTVTGRRPNPLLDREEVTFRLDFAGPMVARADALNALAASLQVPPERVAVRRMRVAYGRPEAIGLARVYATPEALKRVEAPHILRRLSGEKKGKAPAAEKKAPPRAEKKEEAGKEAPKAEKKEGARPAKEEKGGEKPAGSAGAAPPQARTEKKEAKK